MSKKEPKKQVSEEIAEVSETLEQLSNDEPEVISQFMTMARMGSMPNPLHDKLSEEHIGKIVDLAVSHDKNQFEIYKDGQENEFQERKTDKKYQAFYFLAVIASFFAIIIIFKDQPNILIPILTGFGGLVGGFLAGIGYGKSK